MPSKTFVISYMRLLATLSLVEASFKLTTRSEEEFNNLTNLLVKCVKVVSLFFLALVVVVWVVLEGLVVVVGAILG